jgi:ADP-ribosylglycohydrolase
VVATLTAAVWCLLTSKDYRETVLKAVNLGGDTDTTGIVAGGSSGAT